MRTKEAIRQSSPQAFNYDPDKLAERFLEEFYIWHPQEDNPPEQYLDAKLADWTLRWWTPWRWFPAGSARSMRGASCWG